MKGLVYSFEVLNRAGKRSKGINYSFGVLNRAGKKKQILFCSICCLNMWYNKSMTCSKSRYVLHCCCPWILILSFKYPLLNLSLNKDQNLCSSNYNFFLLIWACNLFIIPNDPPFQPFCVSGAVSMSCSGVAVIWSNTPCAHQWEWMANREGRDELSVAALTSGHVLWVFVLIKTEASVHFSHYINGWAVSAVSNMQPLGVCRPPRMAWTGNSL